MGIDGGFATYRELTYRQPQHDVSQTTPAFPRIANTPGIPDLGPPLVVHVTCELEVVAQGFVGPPSTTLGENVLTTMASDT